MKTNTPEIDNAPQTVEPEHVASDAMTDTDATATEDRSDNSGNALTDTHRDDNESDVFFTFDDIPEDYDDTSDDTADYYTEDSDEEEGGSSDAEENNDEVHEDQASDSQAQAAENPENAAQDADGTEIGTNTSEDETAVTERPDAAQSADDGDAGVAPDYAAWEREDVDAIAVANPDIAEQLRGRRLRDVIADPRRFAELRGDQTLRDRLTAAEAFTLAGGFKGAKSNASSEASAGATGLRDAGKAHLRPAPGKAAQQAVTVPREIRRMRDDGMFGDGVSDAELLELFRKVT